ncbi:MAG TPA: serine hydrolase domain-containing protein [Mucilaginibacter sp.]|nr:serine hydrolase domain-containing protein [Mucilaginibacter sp.]
MKKLLIVICPLLILGTTALAQGITQKIDSLVKGYVSIGHFNGTALVARNDKVIFEQGYGYRDEQTKSLNDTGTIFQIASVTKTFTSATVLKLVELKKISLSDKLSKWYPGFPNSDKITIENLLSHTSGIFDYTRDTVSHLNTETNMMTFLAKKPLDFEPGTDWRYSNSGYSILGFIIRKISGMTYEQAVRHYIFTPLHMNHSGFDFEHLQDPEKARGYGMGDNGKGGKRLFRLVGRICSRSDLFYGRRSL